MEPCGTTATWVLLVGVPLGHVHARLLPLLGVAFTPHETSAIGDHFHSEGVEGYGLEFQGDFDHCSSRRYSVLGPTWNTMEDPSICIAV